MRDRDYKETGMSNKFLNQLQNIVMKISVLRFAPTQMSRCVLSTLQTPLSATFQWQDTSTTIVFHLKSSHARRMQEIFPR